MAIKINTKTYIFALFLIAVLVNWKWIFSGAHFVWGDSQLYAWFKESWLGYIGLPKLWSTLYGFGQIDVTLSLYPIFSTFAMLSKLGVDPRLIIKFAYFIPSAFLPVFCSFILIKHLTKANLPAFVGSIVYSYNVTSLMQHATLQPFNVVYGLAPLMLFLFIRALESKSLKMSVLAGLVFFVGSIYEFRIFYIIAYVLLFYLMFHIFIILKPETKREALKIISISVVPFLIVGALNAYWITPLVLAGSIQENSFFSRSLFGTGIMSLKQSVAFFYPWWTSGAGNANGVVQSIPSYFWIIPILALLGFILNLKNKQIYFYAFLSILGILLLKQSDGPFPNLYQWLYDHFPGFNAYRESSKFFVILSLGYSVLIAFLISKLRTAKFLLISTVILIFSIFLVNTVPFTNGSIGSLFTPRSRPQDYDVVKEFLLSQNSFFRTAWLPASGVWGYFDSQHPKINVHTFYFDTLHPILSKQENFFLTPNQSQYIGNINHNVLNLFSQTNSNDIIDLLSIKYIIVPMEDDLNDDNVFVSYGMPDRNYILDYLDNVDFLSRVNIGTKNIIVYENLDYRPLIYLTHEPESIFNSPSFEAIEYEKVNEQQYVFNLEKINGPTYINFSDNYHPGWKMSVNGVPLPESIYINENGLHNNFLLHSNTIKDRIGPTDKIKITIYFDNQKYVYLGSIISLVSILVILGIALKQKWAKR